MKSFTKLFSLQKTTRSHTVIMAEVRATGQRSFMDDITGLLGLCLFVYFYPPSCATSMQHVHGVSRRIANRQSSPSTHHRLREGRLKCYKFGAAMKKQGAKRTVCAVYKFGATLSTQLAKGEAFTEYKFWCSLELTTI